MKIVSESSTAAGVRRIEAITSVAAENYVKEQSDLLNEVKALLKNPKDVVKSISSLLEERTSLNKELEQLVNEKGNTIKTSLLGQITQVNGASVLVAEVNVPNADVLKKISFELKNEVGGLILVLAATVGDKPLLSIMIDEPITTSHQLHAGNMVRDLAKLIKGGGGGQPFYATAGGSDLSGLPEVIKTAKQLLADKGFSI
jgi:alanyl-tRNA synthetase